MIRRRRCFRSRRCCRHRLRRIRRRRQVIERTGNHKAERLRHWVVKKSRNLESRISRN